MNSQLKDQRYHHAVNTTPGPDKYTLPSFISKYTKLPPVKPLKTES